MDNNFHFKLFILETEFDKERVTEREKEMKEKEERDIYNTASLFMKLPLIGGHQGLNLSPCIL